MMHELNHAAIPHPVLPVSVFKKQKCFFVLFSEGCFIFLEKWFLVLFFLKMFFFMMMGKIIVNTAIYHNFLAVPNIFALLRSAY